MSFDNLTCISSRIQLDLPNQIWQADWSDPTSSNLWLRFLHNKVYFLTTNYARCYLSNFSPENIAPMFTIFGTILFFVGLCSAFSKKLYGLIGLLLLCPLPILFELPIEPRLRALPLQISQGLFIIIGLVTAILFLWKVLKQHSSTI